MENDLLSFGVIVSVLSLDCFDTHCSRTENTLGFYLGFRSPAEASVIVPVKTRNIQLSPLSKSGSQVTSGAQCPGRTDKGADEGRAD